MADKISLSALSRFQAPLVEDSIYAFDATQNGSLTPRDFLENGNWVEFVARFVATERTIRIRFVQKMSRNLKIELCWNLFQLWDNADADKPTRRKISNILMRDFKVEVDKLTDYESVKQQVLRRNVWVGIDGSAETGNDTVQGVGYSGFYPTIYGGISNPFHIGPLRLIPNLSGAAISVSGRRSFRDAPDETYTTISGKLSPYISLSDAVNERWSLGGGGYYKHRPNPPKGFNRSEQGWDTYLDLDSPFSWPFTAGIYASSSDSFYAPPLLQGQNQTEEHSNSVGGYFTWNFGSRLALVSSVDHLSEDNTYNYSQYRNDNTTGSLFFKWRRLADFIRLGLNVSSERTHREKIMRSEKRVQNSSDDTLWLGGEYFRFIDEESSISAKLFLSGTASTQEPNTTYPGINATISAGKFLIPKKLFGRFSGNVNYDHMEHREGDVYYEYTTNYSFSPMLRWNFTPDIMLGISASASQTIDRAALQTRSTSFSSNMNLTMNFDIFRGLEVSAYVYANKNWDEDLQKGPGNYDNSDYGGGATATISF